MAATVVLLEKVTPPEGPDPRRPKNKTGIIIIIININIIIIFSLLCIIVIVGYLLSNNQVMDPTDGLCTLWPRTHEL